MALLQNDKIIFYHPVDSNLEFTKNYNWTALASNVSYTGSILTSGLTQTSAGTQTFLQGDRSAGGYPTASGQTRLTACFWASGLYPLDSILHSQIIGFETGGGAFTDVLRLIKTTGNVLQMQAALNGTTMSTIDVTSPVPSNAGWNFVVLDIEKEGVSWRYRASFNGSGFKDLGLSANNIDPSTTPTRTALHIISNTTKVVVDEAVFWAGTTLFTLTELSNLYELYNTYNTTMDQYSQTFPSIINDNIELFIHGNQLVNDNINLYIPGQIEANTLDIFTSGIGFLTNNIDLFIFGANIFNENIDLFIHGIDSVTDSIELSIPQFPVINEINLSIPYSHILFNDSIDLFLQNQFTIDTIDLFLFNQYFNSQIDFFIYGIQTNTWSVFAKIENTTTISNINLFVNGIPSGSPNPIFLISDDITLFIENIEQIESSSGIFNTFVKTETGTLFVDDQTFNLFVKVGHVINGSLDLTIYGHASGDTPHGTQINSNFDISIEGAGETFNENFIPFSDNFFIFVDVKNGLSLNMELFINGFMWPTGEIDTYIFGIIGIENNNFDMFINGSEASTNNIINMFIFGIIDIINNDINLFTFTNLAIENDFCNLYIHGF